MPAVGRLCSKAPHWRSFRASRTLLLGLVACGLLLSAGSHAQAAAGSASISGTVTDSHGDPITSADVCVTAYSTEETDEEEFPTARTNSSGAYTIAGLAAGSYKLYFTDCEGSARNDLPQYYDNQAEYNAATTIALTAGQTQTGADASLASATTISGHAYRGAGALTPLADICVYAYPVTNNGSYIYTSNAETGADGTYTLAHLDPSLAYDVEFYDCRSSREYLTQYYNGASEAGAATEVTPTLASPATGIDAHLESGASISGTVTDSGAHAITSQDICVSVFPATPGVGQSYNEYGEARTNAAGQYTIGALASGSYKVYFSDCSESTRNDAPQYYDHQASAAFAETITLSTAQAQTGVDASLEPATTISGHVYGGSGTSTPLQDICVSAYSTGTGNEYYYDSSFADTDAEGAYTLTHLTPNTSYYIEFSDCASTQKYLLQFYDGASSESQATAVTPTASPLTGIDAHMEKGASISGTVTDSNGKPITTQDICVSVTPASYEDYSENSSGYVATDPSGDYTIGALAPGSYDVKFADCNYSSSSRNDLAQYYDGQSSSTSATPVTLTDKQAQTGINASLQPATAISGHVYGTADTSTPLASICVEAFAASEASAYNELSYTETASDGSYTLRHLTPSVGYKVEFYDCDDPSAYESQFYEDVSGYSSAKVITPTTNATTGIDAHLAVDPLQVTITGGPANGASTNSTEPSFAFTAADKKATFECELDGRGFTPCSSPLQADTLNGGNALANGTHTFYVEASAEGKTGPSTVVSWTVNTGGPTSTSGGSAAAGETFSSDPGGSPSSSAPVITEVTLPVAANIALTDEPATTPSENGYTVFGQQIDIAATDGSGEPVVASASDPIELTFSLDAAEIPAGKSLAEITVLRNGLPAANCTTNGIAAPNPCISNRTTLPNGGAQITVLTTHCSLWNFAFTSASSSNPESGEHGGGTPSNEETTLITTTTNPIASGNGGGSTGPAPQAKGGVLSNVTRHAAAPAKSPTQAQRLAKALAACHKLKKSKRAKCVAAAKKRYPQHKSKAHGKSKG
jgi:hypothetical protein